MAEYLCKLGTASGQMVTQTEEAPSEEEARQRLATQGYYVFSVKPRRRLARTQLGACASGANGFQTSTRMPSRSALR